MSDCSTIEKVVTVIIPSCEFHEGFYKCSVTLYWVCPVCGAPRGYIFDSFSYDGSKKLPCHSWVNQCGHVDKYDRVREEAARNGLN